RQRLSLLERHVPERTRIDDLGIDQLLLDRALALSITARESVGGSHHSAKSWSWPWSAATWSTATWSTRSQALSTASSGPARSRGPQPNSTCAGEYQSSRISIRSVSPT